ncbi:MAG: SGNH/GDSL hydrolase family protein [Candidatus Pelagibacter sp.]
MKKILLYNSIILLILLFFIEIIFGYWFDEYNFGIHMRKHRNKYEFYETKLNNEKYKYIYKRNFYGFRGEEIQNLENIKYVFLGGSTGNERLLPENLTIVGRLNYLLEKKNKNIQIINGSVDGKTLKGHLNDFKYWFTKLNKFNPEYFIIYVGINDSVIDQPDKYDKTFDNNTIKKIRDYIANNSITIELIKNIKKEYFSNFTLKYETSKSNELYKNFNYTNYKEAKKIYNIKDLNNNYKYLSERYRSRIVNLYKQIIHFNSKVIFITQVKYDGLKDEKLFMLNEILKEFSEEKNINIIKLDELIVGEEGDFFDTVHTTSQGSQKISEIIFKELKKIIFP